MQRREYRALSTYYQKSFFSTEIVDFFNVHTADRSTKLLTVSHKYQVGHCLSFPVHQNYCTQTCSSLGTFDISQYKFQYLYTTFPQNKVTSSIEQKENSELTFEIQNSSLNVRQVLRKTMIALISCLLFYNPNYQRNPYHIHSLEMEYLVSSIFSIIVCATIVLRKNINLNISQIT